MLAGSREVPALSLDSKLHTASSAENASNKKRSAPTANFGLNAEGPQGGAGAASPSWREGIDIGAYSFSRL